MIQIILNESNFEYDIHSLVKAFYPGQDVKVRTAEDPARQDAEEGKIRQNPDRLSDSHADEQTKNPILILKISYMRDQKSDAAGNRPGSIRFLLLQRKDDHAPEKELILPNHADALTSFLQRKQRLVFDRTVFVDHADRKETKNLLKQALYRLLCDYTGRELPWGTLTGIRPVRLPMQQLEAGADVREAADFLKREYFVSEQKAVLAAEIAQTEREVLARAVSADEQRIAGTADSGEGQRIADAAGSGEGQRIAGAAGSGEGQRIAGSAVSAAGDNQEIFRNVDWKQRLSGGYSLYIGIPFCPTTCAYCSFASYPAERFGDRMDPYLDALEKEIAFAASQMGAHPNTIYIGGGTPTALSAAQLDRLLSQVSSHFDLNGVWEFTVEAGRPDSITEEKLQVLKSYPVSRISINPQTMKQETLDLIGRRHTVEQFVKSYDLARGMGFDNINMDLIVGLPEETMEDVAHTMEEVSKMAPENVTVHSLAIKRAARLRIDREAFRDYQMINTPEMIDLTQQACKNMGLHPYYLYRQKNMAGNFENVGYARPGFEGMYNILMMEELQSVIALGAGTVSKRVWDGGRIERCDTVKDLPSYILRIDEMIERKKKLFLQ